MSEFEKKITEYKDKIKSASKIEELESLKSEVLGKNGLINLEFKKLGELPVEKKKSFAANINKVKQVNFYKTFRIIKTQICINKFVLFFH